MATKAGSLVHAMSLQTEARMLKKLNSLSGTQKCLAGSAFWKSRHGSTGKISTRSVKFDEDRPRYYGSVKYSVKYCNAVKKSTRELVDHGNFLVHDVIVHALQNLVRFTTSRLLTGALAAFLVFSPPCMAEGASSEGLTITFPTSAVPEISKVQRALVEAWGIVQEFYWDPSYNHQEWVDRLRASLIDTFHVESADKAYDTIRGMLASLDDPYTRIVSPQEYETFRITNDGTLQGVGLLIAADADTGRLIVLSPIEGGPADRAGVHPGDELIQIDDEDLAGLSGTQAANKLRGKAGTSVLLTIRRPTESDEGTVVDELTKVKIKREAIALSPVYSTVLEHTSAINEEENVKTGYIRLSTFSQNAAQDMVAAVMDLQSQGVDNYILDLRNNPGGLVRSGLEVARIWLSGDDILVNTIDRFGDLMPVALHGSNALTQLPLAVLVNKGSASASEILAGALHDNGRAVLIGENTYGKGKIQNVFELGDGSALFVTVARYLSPNLHLIDKVGIPPDMSCGVEEVTAIPSIREISLSKLPRSLLLDVNPGLTLNSDSCVLTAEQVLPIGSD